MRRLLIALSILFSSTMAMASAGNVHLDHMHPNLHDKASLQNGAKLFTNYCLGCHSMEYARYERIATDLGIPAEIYEKNLIFSNDKIGSLMTIAMQSDQSQRWFGSTPPDLTLEGRLRGSDWLYSYLRGFYKDSSRPWGVNNSVFKDVGMPHVLADLQGVCAEEPTLGIEPVVDPLSGSIIKESGCEKFDREGSLSKEQYDEVVYDLVNFMIYMGKPYQLDSQRIGVYVLVFLVFLFMLTWFLNKEYWRDIH